MATTRVTFYLSNIPASSTEPFRIELNDEPFFDTVDTIPKNHTVNLIAELPAVNEQEEDLIIRVRFSIPNRGIIDAEQDFNITQSGNFIMIQLVPNAGGNDDEGDRVSIRQSYKDLNPMNQQHEQQQQKQQQQQQGTGDSLPDMTTAHFHLSNLPANTSQPLEVLLNNKCVFKSVDDLTSPDKRGKVAMITSRLSKPRFEDHIVPLTIKVPAFANMREKSVQLNFSRDGCYVKIHVDDSTKSIQICQDHDDHFKSATHPKSIGVATSSAAPASNNTTNAVATSSQQQAGGQMDYIQELEALASLRNAGILTHEEFEQKKRKILGL